MWSSGPGVAGMNSNDGLGGMTGSQRGSGNMQRVAPGPAVVPVVQSPGPFDLNLSAPFQVCIDQSVMPTLGCSFNSQ